MRQTILPLTGALVRAKGRGYPVPVSGPLLVTEMDPQDLAALSPANMPNYASPANQPLAGRLVSGRPGYWGSDVPDNAALDALLVGGWYAGTQLVADLSEELAELLPPVPQTARRRVRYGDSGDELDYDLWSAGQWDIAWRSMRRERVIAPRIITLDADVGQNCHLPADQLRWSGVAAAALTDLLELAGYRVELYATSACLSNTPGGGACLTRVCVKQADETISPPTVAALVALPATFRWHHLMSWLAHPLYIGAGYGQSCELQEVLDAAAAGGDFESSELVLSGALSREDAVALISKALQELGVMEDAASGTMLD